MKDKPFKELLVKLDTELVSTVKDDVTRHLALLRKNRVDFYGYAIQTPTFTNVEQPIAIYNREGDIEEDNKDSAYYRYSVDEWQNYENNALAKTTTLMSTLDEQFKQLARNPDDDGKIDKYYPKVYKLFAQALAELKAEGAFPEDTFLIVWNEDEELLVKFAKQLNATKVAKVFAEEFGF
ncbi:MAG: DUF4303 domain-containing protein [Planctomycetaceae bacterium]|nr:DUF4303 domain-containing protein [Planctomycetaceae bacterium]